MEKHYKGSNISFQEPGANSKSSKICIAFLTFMVDIAFGNQLATSSHEQKVSFLQMHR